MAGNLNIYSVAKEKIGDKKNGSMMHTEASIDKGHSENKGERGLKFPLQKCTYRKINEVPQAHNRTSFPFCDI